MGSRLTLTSGRWAQDPSVAPGPIDTGPKLAMGCSPMAPVGASQLTWPTDTYACAEDEVGHCVAVAFN